MLAGCLILRDGRCNFAYLRHTQILSESFLLASMSMRCSRILLTFGGLKHQWNFAEVPM